ncbi:hypothetical protein ACNOYE_35405 [Nannocystaceae bacterium ST9]
MSPRDRALVALAWALTGVVALVIVARTFGPTYAVAGDAHYVLATARSLAFDGDLDLTNQYWIMGDRWGLGRDPASDGWRLPPRELGASLLMVPGLWARHGLGFDPRWEPTFACLLAAASLAGTWLGCLACLDAIDDRAGRGRDRSRPWIAGAMILASVAPFYAIGRSGYAHAPDALACAWLTWALVARRSPVVVGALLACTVLIRMQNLLWLAWPLLELVRAAAGERRAEAARVAVIVAIASLALAPQAWLALVHPGSVQGSIRWDLGFFDLRELGSDVVRVVFGVHGLVRWTPLAGLGLLGLIARARDGDAKPSLIVAALVLLCACVRDVDGGDAFGARRLAGIVPLLAIGLAAAWDRTSGRTRSVAIVAGVIAVIGNLALIGLAIAGEVSLAAS